MGGRTYLIPGSDGHVDAARTSGSGRSSGDGTLTVIFEGRGLFEGLREQVRVRGGGNVQIALGQN
jgi:hypothetical protein